MSEWSLSSAMEGFKRTTLPGMQGISLTSPASSITPPALGIATSDPDPSPSRLELAISGTGFFAIKISENETVFTRMGSFSINSEGVVVNSSGSELYPQISLPSNRKSVTVASNGEVSVLVEGSSSATHVGNIQLAKFINPEGLEELGMNMYRATEASGTPLTGTPGSNGFGAIVQNIETSPEISETERLVDQIAAERAHELSSSVIRQDGLVSRGPKLI